MGDSDSFEEYRSDDDLNAPNNVAASPARSRKKEEKSRDVGIKSDDVTIIESGEKKKEKRKKKEKQEEGGDAGKKEKKKEKKTKEGGKKEKRPKEQKEEKVEIVEEKVKAEAEVKVELPSAPAKVIVEAVPDEVPVEVIVQAVPEEVPTVKVTAAPSEVPEVISEPHIEEKRDNTEIQSPEGSKTPEISNVGQSSEILPRSESTTAPKESSQREPEREPAATTGSSSSPDVEAEVAKPEAAETSLELTKQNEERPEVVTSSEAETVAQSLPLASGPAEPPETITSAPPASSGLPASSGPSGSSGPPPSSAPPPSSEDSKQQSASVRPGVQEILAHAQRVVNENQSYSSNVLLAKSLIARQEQLQERLIGMRHQFTDIDSEIRALKSDAYRTQQLRKHHKY